jgi:hypothetical protein
MEVIELGRLWFVVVAGHRFEFRHDGRGGAVQMGEGGRWAEVNPRWEADHSLCWGSVCVRGDIPLD